MQLTIQKTDEPHPEVAQELIDNTVAQLSEFRERMHSRGFNPTGTHPDLNPQAHHGHNEET